MLYRIDLIFSEQVYAKIQMQWILGLIVKKSETTVSTRMEVNLLGIERIGM